MTTIQNEFNRNLVEMDRANIERDKATESARHNKITEYADLLNAKSNERNAAAREEEVRLKKQQNVRDWVSFGWNAVNAPMREVLAQSNSASSTFKNVVGGFGGVGNFAQLIS